jgi:YtkA-like protein
MAPEALASRVIAGILAWCCLLAGCSRSGPDVTVTWNLDPPRPLAEAEVLVRLTLRDADGAPVSGAKLRCDAQMSHPGMAPIVGALIERGQGIYETRLRLSMPGDWVLVASGELPDGRRVTSSSRVPGVQPAKASDPVP